MRWHYNLSHENDPLIKDLWTGAAGAEGRVASIALGSSGALVQAAAAVPIDVIGVQCEPAGTASTLTTGTINFLKYIVNPDAVFLAAQDLAAANDIDVVSSTTAAVTLGTTDANMVGGWIYINTGTAAGQLGFIGASSTTVMTIDTTSAFPVAPASDSDCVLIRPKWDIVGGRDLASTVDMLATDEDETGDILVLENFIQSSTIPFEPLLPRKHHNLSGLNATGINIKFYSDVHFQDHVLLVNTV